MVVLKLRPAVAPGESAKHERKDSQAGPKRRRSYTPEIGRAATRKERAKAPRAAAAKMTPSFFMTADATGKTPAALLIGRFTGKSGATNVPRAALAAQPTLRLTFRSMRFEP